MLRNRELIWKTFLLSVWWLMVNCCQVPFRVLQCLWTRLTTWSILTVLFVSTPQTQQTKWQHFACNNLSVEQETVVFVPPHSHLYSNSRRKEAALAWFTWTSVCSCVQRGRLFPMIKQLYYTERSFISCDKATVLMYLTTLLQSVRSSCKTCQLGKEFLLKWNPKCHYHRNKSPLLVRIPDPLMYSLVFEVISRLHTYQPQLYLYFLFSSYVLQATVFSPTSV